MWFYNKGHIFTYLQLGQCFAVIVIGTMAKLQKTSACAGKLPTRFTAIGAEGAEGARGDEEGHFHLARLRGRRPPAGLLC